MKPKLQYWILEELPNGDVKCGIGINGPQIYLQCNSLKAIEVITEALNEKIEKDGLNPYNFTESYQAEKDYND